MKVLRLLIGLCLLFCMTTEVRGAGAFNPDAGKVDFTSLMDVWHDGHRDRDVPVKIYYPAAATRDRLPIIIFSHGLGGSRDGYAYLGEYWASHGFVSVHLTHHGSDTDAIRTGGLANLKATGDAIAKNPANAIDRCRDVSFAIDQLTEMDGDEKSPLYGRLDITRIGMAGHSFGGNTTMLVIGELTKTGKSALADNRIKCAIAMSPPLALPEAAWDNGFASVNVPLFVMTGTRDNSPIGDTTAADRRVGFDHVKAPAYLITFQDGDHMLFSGRRVAKLPTDDRYHDLILKGSLAFWDAYLRGNDEAKKWLGTGGYDKLVGDAGKFEERNLEAAKQ